MSQLFYQLSALTRELESLNQTKTALTNQLHALIHTQFESKLTQKRLLSIIKLVDNQITSIKEEVVQLLESNPELKRKLEQITQIKGVGLINAITVMAETGGPDTPCHRSTWIYTL